MPSPKNDKNIIRKQTDFKIIPGRKPKSMI